MLERWITDSAQRSLIYLSLVLLLMVLVYAGVAAILRHYGKNPKYMLPAGTVRKVAWPLILILFSLLLRVQALRNVLGLEEYGFYFRKASTLIFIFSLTWLIIRLLRMVKELRTTVRQSMASLACWSARNVPVRTCTRREHPAPHFLAPAGGQIGCYAAQGV